MVFFTCNACGASLKKNQVDKHYQNECPRCEVLSCMDCGRDFQGDEYANHTKCISEAEKYQGGLFRETGSGGKGEKKQQEWLERVQVLLAEGTKVNPRIGRLLERVAQYPNIPRKKSKFENFVKNSINVRDQQTLGELWEVFSTAIKPVTSEGDHSASTTAETNTDPKGVNEEDCEAAPVMKKEMKKEKKKKEKKEKVQESETCDVAGVDSGEKDKEMKTKRKKRKRKTADTVVEDVSESPDVDDSCKPKKKKKRKSESGGVTLTEADQVGLANCHTTPTKKKKKSKKEKSALVEEIDGVEVGVGPMQVALEYINSHHSSEGAGEKKAKKIKKKRKSEGEGVVEEGLDEPVSKKHKHKTHS